MSALTWIAAAALAVWLYLTFLHGRFWRADQWLDGAEDGPSGAAPPGGWPPVIAVVPARNEADVLPTSLGSLLTQDYPGSFRVILVDDHSDDGTGAVARALGSTHPGGARLIVTDAASMPPGWVGKMWAVATGTALADAATPPPTYLLLTDADVAHDPASVRRLVGTAERRGLDLVSLMVLLDCTGGIERLLVPAFVYFFQQLYPFPRINDPRTRTAGAAGGCMLVRARALAAAGGIAAIRSEIIDDCALGRLLKRRGPVWLGLTRRLRSLRPYAGLGGVWHMVARTAYTQLGYSPLVLAATVLALALVYLVPPLAVLGWPFHHDDAAALLGAAAWLLMALTFLPTLRLYDRRSALAAALPVAGLLYVGMTLDSALRHHRGRGATWKGRAGAGHADAASVPGGRPS